MNESPGDVWFFSRDGHQSGPITFAELKEKADEGALRPRHDLAWSAGMPEWKPVGEIEGLFERRVPTTTNEAQLIAADPQTAEPTAWPAQDGTAQEEWPGTRRRGYLFALVIFPILWAVVLSFAKPFLESQFGKDLPAGALTAIQFIPAVIILLANIQRLANLGMSRLWILGYLIPFLGFWVLYRSVACPAGYARHKKMDGVGIFLAIIYWLVIVLAIASLVLLALALFGVLGDGAIQNEIKEQLEQFKPPAEAPAQ